LIPPNFAAELAELPRTRSAILGFSERVEIHPGIVVGRMQHEKLIELNWLNDLKVNVQFTNQNQ